jgi:hypothetical protein
VPITIIQPLSFQLWAATEETRAQKVKFRGQIGNTKGIGIDWDQPDIYHWIANHELYGLSSNNYWGCAWTL